MICSNAQRLEFLECSNFSKNRIVRMLKLLNAQKLELLNVRIAQMLELLNAQSPPKKCSKSPVPCKKSKFKNSKLRQSRNNSKFKNQNSKFTSSPSPPRQCFCRTVRYVRASAYTWRLQTCPPLLCSRPVSGSRGSRPSRCRRSL